MSTILSNVTTLLSSVTTWVGTFIECITDNEILTLFCLVLPLVGLGIGIIKRLVKVRA